MKGLCIRARASWIEHGEEPTKYFCKLEKRNYTYKNIARLFDATHEKFITSQTEILTEINTF